MLPPKCLSATKPRKSWGSDLCKLDSDLIKEPDAILGGAATDSEFFHQRFRNFLYVEFVGPRKTLIKLRNLCLDWLQPDSRTKEEIVELLVLEQYLAILPEKIKPWVQARKPENCEKLVTLLESCKGTHELEDDGSSDAPSEDSMSRKGTETPPPRSIYSFCSDQDWDRDWDHDQDRDRDWEQDRRGRSRELASRDCWPFTRSPRSRLPQRGLALPPMEKTTLAMEREHQRRASMMDYESRRQDAVSYQDVVDLTEDRKPQNPIQDNMENYRKLLSLGVQLAEDDGHSHMTQGHSSRSKRSAYPSTGRGLKTMPEAKKSTHRRGICEDESSHGVIMDKFIKDVSRNSKSGRAKESNGRPQRFPRRPDGDWREVPFNKRASVIQERGYEGNAFGGGFTFNSNLVSRKRVLERKRRYHFDTDGDDPVHDQRGCAKRKSFEYSDKSHTITRPPENEEQEKAFTVSSNPEGDQKFSSQENVCEWKPNERSVIHSLAFAKAQKSCSSVKPNKPTKITEAAIQTSGAIDYQEVHAGDSTSEGKKHERSVIHSLSAFRPPESHTENELAELEEKGESSAYVSGLHKQQKTTARDNPYEKNAATGTSLQCRVCGRDFIHGSVLNEHMVIHTEENSPEQDQGTEAAQEVEANVLVPREVLRIQGSNVEAAEPEVEAAEPDVEAAEPNVEAAEPNGEAGGPDGEAAEPNGEAEQPNGEAEQPSGDADEPDGAGIEDPEERAEEPEGDANEPDGAGVEDPEEEGEDRQIQVGEPYYDCRECGETFTSHSAYGEHLKTHARVIILEPGNVYGESSHYTEHASTSTGDSDRARDKYFRCDVCGQLFSDRLSLVRHQNTHTG
ncbi:Paternally-Expressed 3 Protein [Manis pentadactyla]|nr:Paternally-Expressed 3 Protein [Manis pentadactyla]